MALAALALILFLPRTRGETVSTSVAEAPGAEETAAETAAELETAENGTHALSLRYEGEGEWAFQTLCFLSN